jgi:hypothetical protein
LLDIARPWHQRSQTIPRRLVLRAQLAEATTSRLPTSSTSTKDLQKVRILCGQSRQWLSSEGRVLKKNIMIMLPSYFHWKPKETKSWVTYPIRWFFGRSCDDTQIVSTQHLTMLCWITICLQQPEADLPLGFIKAGHQKVHGFHLILKILGY